MGIYTGRGGDQPELGQRDRGGFSVGNQISTCRNVAASLPPELPDNEGLYN